MDDRCPRMGVFGSEKRTDWMTCPNCQSLMTPGEMCPECNHEDDRSCICEHCIMQVGRDEDEYNEEDE